MRIVAFSDTHSHHRQLTVPEGDILIFGGDLMTCGRRLPEVISFGNWFSNLPHPNKILIAGNHDRMFEHRLGDCLKYFKNVTYLMDSSVEVNGIKFFGSPWQPWFNNWSFNAMRGAAIKQHWDRIPPGTDVLVTHGPPNGVLDLMSPESEWAGEHLGCEELRKVVDKISPKVHIFGHIHGSYGQVEGVTESFNVSICNEQYQPVNPVTVIDL